MGVALSQREATSIVWGLPHASLNRQGYPKRGPPKPMKYPPPPPRPMTSDQEALRLAPSRSCWLSAAACHSWRGAFFDEGRGHSFFLTTPR